MSEKIYLEDLEPDQYGRVKITFQYGDAIISGKVIDLSLVYFKGKNFLANPLNLVYIEGYPFQMTIPFKAVLVEVENIVPGESENNPIAFDTADYKREYLGKWVKINGVKTGKLIGRVHTDELKEDRNRLEVKDTYVFDDGKTWVCHRTGPVES